MSLLINAGEGIDVDLFLYRQDKGKTLERIGRRIRLNRSKIKDASDTNSDFDDLAESIQAGYYLKNGLSSSEEFYYLCVLVTVTGYSAREVEWRAKEMKKLLNAQDMDTVSCVFKEEQGFRSALPLLDRVGGRSSHLAQDHQACSRIPGTASAAYPSRGTTAPIPTW